MSRRGARVRIAPELRTRLLDLRAIQERLPNSRATLTDGIPLTSRDTMRRVSALGLSDVTRSHALASREAAEHFQQSRDRESSFYVRDGRTVETTRGPARGPAEVGWSIGGRRRRRLPHFWMAGGGQRGDMGRVEPRVPVSDDRIYQTPHGAVAFRTEKGLILIRPGSSTIKDFSGEANKQNIRLLIAPDQPMLSWPDGKLTVDQEGWMYVERFYDPEHPSKAHVAVSQRVLPHAKTIVEHSYFGPPDDWVTHDIVSSMYPQWAQDHVPNLLEEMRYWRNNKLEDMIEYHPFNHKGVLEFEELRIIDRGRGTYSIYENERYVGDVEPVRFPMHQFPFSTESLLSDSEIVRVRDDILKGAPYIAAPSSGSLFSTEETSGHVRFIAGRAYVVDPPIHTPEWFAANRLSLSMIDEVDISHVHIDHFGGLLRLLSKMTHRPKLVANQIVARQIVEMYHAMGLGFIDKDTIRAALNIHEVGMMQPVYVGRNTSMSIVYNLAFHSHPTTRYDLVLDQPGVGSSRAIFSHSSDTQADPRIVEPLINRRDPDNTETGRMIISGQARLADITEGPFAALRMGGFSNLDGGFSPFHFGIEAIARRIGEDTDVRRRAVVHHEGREKIETAGLRYFGDSLREAISLAEYTGWTPPTAEGLKRKMIRAALRREPLLENRLSRAAQRELARKGGIQQFEDGDVIILEGGEGDKAYVLIDGQIDIRAKKPDGDGDFSIVKKNMGLFGETAVLTGKPRTASVVAVGQTTVAEFPADLINRIFGRAGIAQRYIRLPARREKGEAAFAQSPLLNTLDADSRGFIFALARPWTFEVGEDLMHEGETSNSVMFIIEGQVEVTVESWGASREPVPLGPGGVVGEMALIGGGRRRATVTAVSDQVLVYEVTRGELLKHPSILSRLMALLAERNEAAASGSD